MTGRQALATICAVVIGSIGVVWLVDEVSPADSCVPDTSTART